MNTIAATLTVVAVSSLVPAIAHAGDLEQPEYSVETRDGSFEIRRYQPHLVASTVVSGDMKEASNQGFRRLADYIFGGNRSADGGSEKIAMTSPVNMVRGDEGWTITFMMPSAYDQDTLPTPNDSRVTIERWNGGLHAAVRFSGTWSASRFTARRQALEQWLSDRGYRIAGESIVARYDPPWTPWFLRRNEVVIPVTAATPDEDQVLDARD
jgi:hypothetical protein